MPNGGYETPSVDEEEEAVTKSSPNANDEFFLVKYKPEKRHPGSSTVKSHVSLNFAPSSIDGLQFCAAGQTVSDSSVEEEAEVSISSYNFIDKMLIVENMSRRMSPWK